MGMPACRIGDLTEHGGTIMVGFPTVLIGEMPASRIGDMHVCPMVTPGVPPIPHVGGPFVLGSPTVIVGMMPQSRVTDMLVCVGPPDQAALGCMTVLVGMAGGAGAAGAAAGAGAAGGAAPAGSGAGSTAAGSSSTARPMTVATRQPDGSIQTASTGPASLPPMTLRQPGWPDLPPENTATFQSVQPATVLPGTQLYATNDGDDSGENSYWSTSPPDPSAPGPSANDSSASDPSASDPSASGQAGSDPSASNDDDGAPAADASANPGSSPAQSPSPDPSSNYLSSSSQAAALAKKEKAAATHVSVLTVTSAAGLKAWAGKSASAGKQAAESMQVWAPPAIAKAAGSAKNYRLPGAGGGTS